MSADPGNIGDISADAGLVYDLSDPIAAIAASEAALTSAGYRFRTSMVAEFRTAAWEIVS